MVADEGYSRRVGGVALASLRFGHSTTGSTPHSNRINLNKYVNGAVSHTVTRVAGTHEKKNKDRYA